MQPLPSSTLLTSLLSHSQLLGAVEVPAVVVVVVVVVNVIVVVVVI